MRREIIGFPNYYIYDDGMVWSELSGIFLKTTVNNRGYRLVRGRKRDGTWGIVTVHRLVAMHFLPKPKDENSQVDHIDGNKLNNNASNLQWLTSRENIHRKPGLLTDEQIREIRLMHKSKCTQSSIAAHFGVSQVYISQIVRGKRKEYVE